MSQLPPGPKRVSPLHLVRTMIDPHAANLRLARLYGDPFMIRTFIGPMVVTGDPEGIRDFFTADPDAFEYFAPEMEAPLFGERALIFASGERHRADRKLLAPSFHGARMRSYGPVIASVTSDEIARWVPGERFDVLRSTLAISLDVIIRSVIGVIGPEQVAAFRTAALELARSVTPPLIFFTSLRRRFGGVGPYARFLRASDRMDALIKDEIAMRRREAAGAPVSLPREDILSLMVRARYDSGAGLDDEKLRDEIRVMLFGGHETTAVSIAWALYEIHRDHAVKERLLSEIDPLGDAPEPDAIAALPYLDAVCHETLRLHTVFPEVVRMLKKGIKLRGFDLPAGVAVGAALTVLHQREDLYPEPHLFRPQRFLERRFSPYEFAPFGGGTHRCLGAAFGMYEMKIVLARMLRAAKLRLATEAPIQTVRRGVTMGPKGGVPMVFEGERTKR